MTVFSYTIRILPNRGREVTYHNVVRNLLKVGDWNGSAGNWTVPLENISREGVDAAAVYLQDGNREKPGPMLGAAYTSLHWLSSHLSVHPCLDRDACLIDASA